METSKIDFAFFWTFLEFLWILQVTGQNFKKVKNLFALRSLELFWFHTNALGFYSKVPARMRSNLRGPRRRRGVRRRQCGTGAVNKWYGASIRHTTDLLVEVARPEMLPASGGSESVAARPPRPEVRRGAGRCEAMCCGTNFKGS
jgi:hypothetical protein